MADPRLQRLARTLVQYSINAQPGDQVAIRCLGSVAAALPLQAEVLREVLRARAHPHLVVLPALSDEFDSILYTEADEHQLQHIDPSFKLIATEFECDIGVLSETNTRRLSNVDSARQATRRRAYSELIKQYFQRASRGELRWVWTAIPTCAYAQDAEMSLQEYEDFVYSATYSDSDDPVSAWNAVAKRQKKVVEWLLGKKQVHVRGRYIDITFSIDGRTFISCDGHLNMPDGEVFTGPVDGTVNGWFESSFPAVEYGVDVGKVAFRFEDGIAVRAEAEKNQDHLTKMLETDEGARRVGEFGIGTNDRIKLFTKNMLFDEKIGGTIHLAVGRAYPETGAKNESAIHWDFLCDMKDGGQIIVDDQVLYESGKFAV